LLNAAATVCKAPVTKKGDSHLTGMRNSPINTQVETALAEQQPVISVDTKKKEPSAIFVTTAANIASGSSGRVRVL
jgi:hypothetical protein